MRFRRSYRITLTDVVKKFRAIVSFAKDGDPSQSGIPWGEYDVESRNTMIIGRDASMYMESDPKKEQREILLPYFYDYWINQ